MTGSASFTFVWRNPGHWDVSCNVTHRRIYTIRGESPNCWVTNERGKKNEAQRFRHVHTCMAYICGELSDEQNAQAKLCRTAD